jgi:hypothetical protein
MKPKTDLISSRHEKAVHFSDRHQPKYNSRFPLASAGPCPGARIDGVNGVSARALQHHSKYFKVQYPRASQPVLPIFSMFAGWIRYSGCNRNRGQGKKERGSSLRFTLKTPLTTYVRKDSRVS